MGYEVMFLCPTCGRRAKRLALLRGGAGCAKCLDIKWGSERESKIARLVRRIDEIAGALELQDWYEVPRAKPKGMRVVRYLRLVQRRQRPILHGDAGSGAITESTCTRRCWRWGGERGRHRQRRGLPSGQNVVNGSRFARLTFAGLVAQPAHAAQPAVAVELARHVHVHFGMRQD